MINAQNFQISYTEALQAFGQANCSGSAFGKWVLSQVGSTSGFWGGADYDFFFVFRDLCRMCKQAGKRPSKPLVFWVNKNGRGCLTMGSLTLGDK